MDVSNEDSVESLLNNLKENINIDILINNANDPKVGKNITSKTNTMNRKFLVLSGINK